MGELADALDAVLDIAPQHRTTSYAETVERYRARVAELELRVGLLEVAADAQSASFVQAVRPNLLIEAKQRADAAERRAESVAELEQRAAGDEMPIVFNDDVYPAHVLRDRIIAAERRAEAAERQNAAILDVVAQGGRLLTTLPIAVNLTTADASATVDNVACYVGLTQLQTPAKPRVIHVAFFEFDSSPDPTRLERRAVELIEAGERLLAEYRKSQEVKELAMYECRECGHVEARDRYVVEQRCSQRIPGDDEGRCGHFMRMLPEQEVKAG